MSTETKQSIRLDHLRHQLGLSGRVIRDQQQHQYVLCATDGSAAPLGNRWREAEQALRQRTGKPVKRH